MANVSKGLTMKMQNFCNAYARNGGNATEAYLEAYNTTNRTSANIESTKLLRRDDITEYLKELNKPTINAITNEREKKRRIIWERIEICRQNDDDAAIARYMDILNKMDSEYVNISRTTDEHTVAFAQMSVEELRKIADSVPQSTETE